MSRMVSARIEDELCVQASDIMKQRGYTPTQLISSAYVFMVENRCLPCKEKPASVSHVIDESQREQLQDFFAKAIFETDVLNSMVSSVDGTEYDNLLISALEDEYENIR